MKSEPLFTPFESLHTFTKPSLHFVSIIALYLCVTLCYGTIRPFNATAIVWTGTGTWNCVSPDERMGLHSSPFEPSRVQSDTPRRGVDYFVYLLWPSAGMRTHRQCRVESSRVESSRVESSRVESSTVEYSRVQSDAAETIWLTYYGRAQVRTDTVQPSPVQPDSPRHGISLTL